VTDSIIKKNNTYGLWWPWKMAWRDSRKSRGKLILFIASISLGIGALVGITSFRENLMREVDIQAKNLLGADLSVDGKSPLPDSLFHEFAKLSNAESREVSFASMVLFERSQATRLVEVRALEGEYPYYGEIETLPISGSKDFRTTGQKALVDEKLMLQFDVMIGDSVQVGKMSFEVVGKIQRIPGQSDVGNSVAPVVYIPMAFLEETGLLQKGSRINYTTYFQLDPAIDTTDVYAQSRDIVEAAGFDVDNVEDRKKQTGRAFRDLSSFLELIAFAALLLGCLGVSSSIYVYIKGKIQIVAVLRCMGMQARHAINIYLIQVGIFGFIGAVMGCLIGVAIHLFLPEIAKSFIPFEINPTIYWPAIAAGLVIGVVISILFGLLSLIGLRKVSPLATLRFGFESLKIQLDRPFFLIIFSILFFLYLSMYWQLKDPLNALIYLLILLASLVLLYGLAVALNWLMKRLLPIKMGFVWRQGISNLYRPNNQTVILITTLGLSTTFLAMLFFMQDLLVQRVSISGENERPNTILFDIQTDQKEALKVLTEEYDLPVLQEVPIVTMRLIEINGLNKEMAEEDTTVHFPNWAFNREYRITYRDTLIDSESIIEGRWQGQYNDSKDSLYISVSKGYAENLHLNLGDKLIFNVQGALITTYIGSFRDIDWRRIQTNFLVLFPTGVLEKAPQFHVLITRIDKNELSARYQQAVVRQFPNISIIDLELILKTLEELLGKIAFVIQFMSVFSIGTGLIVMISAIILSKFQRMRENVLLRTIGASKAQLWKIISAEYFFLGALGAFAGLFLAIIFTSLLGYFVFEFTYVPNGVHVGSIFLLVTMMTVLIGLLNSRSIVRQSPLQILRSEI
jgi:putative ABC transport system permease protein